MDPWSTLFMPLSGPVTQGFHMMENLFSPQYNYEVNFAGDRKIEQQVVTGIASYGDQLGHLLPVVIALAENDRKLKSNEALMAKVKRLKEIDEQVAEAKDRSRNRTLYELEKDLQKLAKDQPESYRALVQRLEENLDSQ